MRYLSQVFSKLILELKRALAVQMSQHGQRYRNIHDILQASVGFFTASRQHEH